MPKATFKERLIAGHIATGWQPWLKNRSSYAAYCRVDQKGIERRHFIGESGALRSGDSASQSYSIGCPSDVTPIYEFYLRKGDERLNKDKPQSTAEEYV